MYDFAYDKPASLADAVKLLSDDMDAFLSSVPNPRLFKPFDPADLRDQVSRLVQKAPKPA